MGMAVELMIPEHAPLSEIKRLLRELCVAVKDAPDDWSRAEVARLALAWLDAQPTQSQAATAYTLNDLRETLAAYAHGAWAHWMEYMLSDACGCSVFADQNFVLYPGKVRRWKRQMATPYAQLPESEKESDRNQADQILALLPSPSAQRTLAQTPEPDWEAYPEAKYFAADASGVCAYFRYEPVMDRTHWTLQGFLGCDYWNAPNINLPIGIDWRTTLQRRPENPDA